MNKKSKFWLADAKAAAKSNAAKRKSDSEDSPIVVGDLVGNDTDGWDWEVIIAASRVPILKVVNINSGEERTINNIDKSFSKKAE